MAEATEIRKCVVGIDLGTTYSCVGIYRNGAVEIIPNDSGNLVTPSFVAFTDKERLIGDEAMNQVARNPENTVFDAKRLVGRHFHDQTVQDDMKLWPFKVINAKGDYPMIEVEYMGEKRTFFPEQISSMVLVKMKETAERYLGQTVKDAVITVPAYFNDAQRQATKDAGMIAGINVLRIINEPTAAAISYGLGRKSDDVTNILIYDLGGGTFDVSLVVLDEHVFEVKATSGDTHLGGEDFDNRLVEYCIEDFANKNGGLNIRESNRAVRRLRTQCERAKRALSSSMQADIEIDALFDGIDYVTTITRELFENMCIHYFNATMTPVQQVLEDSGLNVEEVHEVVLVGGSTRIPKVQELIKDFFGGKEPCRSVNPDEAVAAGAAIEAGILANIQDAEDQILLLDVTPLSLGIETAGGIMTTLIPRNTTVPTKATQEFTTMKNMQKDVKINVYEGERGLTADNHLLGNMRLGGIPELPKGQAKVEVTYMVDTNGILNVSGIVSATGTTNEMTIVNQRRLPKEEIDRLVAEAEEFRVQDEENKERIQSKLRLEQSLYLVRHALQKEIAASNRAPWTGGNGKEEGLSQLADGYSQHPENLSPVTSTHNSGTRVGSKGASPLSESHDSGIVLGSQPERTFAGVLDGASTAEPQAKGIVTGTPAARSFAGVLDGASMAGPQVEDTVTGTRAARSFAGVLDGASVAGSQAAGTVAGTRAAEKIAGVLDGASMVGSQAAGTVAGSQAVGTVAGTRTACKFAGVLHGASMVGSQAAASMTGSHIGGTVARSQAEGTVAGTQAAGKFAGVLDGASMVGSQAARTAGGSDVGGSVAGTRVAGTAAGSHVGGTVAGSQVAGTAAGTQAAGSEAGSRVGGSVVGSRAPSRYQASSVAMSLVRTVYGDDRVMSKQDCISMMDSVSQSVEDRLEWLERNQLATKDEYEHERGELALSIARLGLELCEIPEETSQQVMEADKVSTTF